MNGAWVVIPCFSVWLVNGGHMACNLIHCKFASMTIEEANRLIISSLTGHYDEREAASISSLVMERLTGMPKGLRLSHKNVHFSIGQQELFQQFLEELLRGRPVQYVLGEAWFGPFSFYVNENVLIPRPETEELVEWILDDKKSGDPAVTVLDIGTGSGCIPVYIKKKRKDFNVNALDISQAALDIAKRNSLAYQADINFFLCDILDPSQWGKLPSADLIISNPPYVPEKQKVFLDRHVRDFEPALALFVPDDEPILFYKIIGDFAAQKMLPGGSLFLEIHHDYAKDIMKWYGDKGFSLELKKDFSGNNRMIKALRN
jgi:release factor glutamine methyltransferase